MFPERFARDRIELFTEPGERVLDPFCGRGTSVLEALLVRRIGLGIDINPVAYCVTAAKANVPDESSLISEIDELELRYGEKEGDAARDRCALLPTFFWRAFHSETLPQIVFLRSVLNWKGNPVHRFLAALCLGCLHGERGKPMQYLSNQMPRTISPKPAYAVRYWASHGFHAPRRGTFDLLRTAVSYRLSTGTPPRRGQVWLGDARNASRALRQWSGKVDLVVTSPPYFDVTRYEEDQWLRLWFLGHDDHPTYSMISRDDRYGSRDRYWKFLMEVWRGVAPLVREGAMLALRVGGRGLTVTEISEGVEGSVRAAFARARLVEAPRVDMIRKRQTGSFRPGSGGCRFELDLTFELRA